MQQTDLDTDFAEVAEVAPTLNQYGEETPGSDDAALLVAAAAQTKPCDDGSPPGGVGGYLTPSGCSQAILVNTRADCTVTHSDTPGGSSADTLTVTCDNPRCLERDYYVKVYVPADLPGLDQLTPEQRALLQDANFEEGRGWKVAQMEITQTVGSDGTLLLPADGGVQPVQATSRKWVTSSGGAVGVTVTAGPVTSTVGPNRKQAVSRAAFNLALPTPFGQWRPNFDYNLEIRTNANGAPSAYSPNTNDPANGLYYGRRQRTC